MKKFAKESFTVMNELVLPNDTNTLNNLMGGRLLHWMDIAAAIAAQKHANRTVVTVSVDNVSFQHPIKLGEVVSIEAQVTRAFKTSMEVRLTVWAQNFSRGTRVESNTAYYTFVGIDDTGKTIPAPEIIPETEEEVRLFTEAQTRRELRLMLAGKLEAKDALQLQTLLNKAIQK